MIRLLILLLLFSNLINVYAETQPRDPSECPDYTISNQTTQCERDRIESTKEIKFVNAYFGIKETLSKIEVSPNDGIKNLIVVLTNNGHFELSGLRAWLTLPHGFESVDGDYVAFATYDLTIRPADVIYLEFPVKINDVKIGVHNAKLYVEYFRVREQGLQFKNMDIEFRVTGKSILDTSSKINTLKIGINEIEIDIINKGSAPAYSVTASLSSPTLGIIGEKTIPINTIMADSANTIKAKLYAPPHLANSIQRLIITLEYYDSYGIKNGKIVEREYMVEGSTGRIDLAIEVDKNIIEVLKSEKLSIKIRNDGYDTANNVEIFINNPVSGHLSIIGDGYYFIDSIDSKEEKIISVELFATESASTKLSEIPINIRYVDSDGGRYEINRKVSVYAKGTILLSVYGLSISSIGNKPSLSGFLLNEGTETALFTRIEANNISQYIGDLDPNSPTPFALEINDTSIREVKMRITYKDVLREEHELVLNLPIEFTAEPSIVREEQERFEFRETFIIAAIASIAAISLYIIRKRRQERL